MALLTDIKRMQEEGKTEQEIISTLRQQGISAREIIEALSQSKIKEAVSGVPEAPQPGYQQETLAPTPQGEDAAYPVQSQNAQSMQLSQEYVPAQPAPMEPSTQYYPQPQQYQQQTAPPQEAYPEYPQYPQAQGGISPDTITEISEQVVSEKISPLRKDIEKIIDFKTTVDSKISYIDERLQRIEKIIDRLNLSIMQKVGDYMTNIDDIKKEIIETQKSFKTLVPSLKEKPKREE